MQIKRNYRRPDPAGKVLIFKQSMMKDSSVHMKQIVDKWDAGFLANKI